MDRQVDICMDGGYYKGMGWEIKQERERWRSDQKGPDILWQKNNLDFEDKGLFIFNKFTFLEQLQAYNKIEKVKMFSIYSVPYTCTASPTFCTTVVCFLQSMNYIFITQSTQFTFGFTLSVVHSVGLDICLPLLYQTEWLHCPKKQCLSSPASPNLQ